MIDHTGLAVGDYERSKAFYVRALAPLGYRVMMEAAAGQAGGRPAAGLGDTKPDFWLAGGGPTSPPVHVAFAAKNRAAVDSFYRAALAAGGRDNGPPGMRAHYHPDYYGAFVLDPDGHNVEAVCHHPPGGAPKAKGAAAKRATAKGKKKAAGRSTGRAGAKRKKR